MNPAPPSGLYPKSFFLFDHTNMVIWKMIIVRNQPCANLSTSTEAQYMQHYQQFCIQSL